MVTRSFNSPKIIDRGGIRPALPFHAAKRKCLDWDIRRDGCLDNLAEGDWAQEVFEIFSIHFTSRRFLLYIEEKISRGSTKRPR
jgi:hypothetical protein